MHAKETMEEVADVFADHTDTYFAAVNCWTAQGDCYREFGEGKKAAQGSAGGARNAAQQVRLN